MNILFITRKFPPSAGGMETYSQQLFEHMCQAPDNVDLYKPGPAIIGRPTFYEFTRFAFGACRLLLSRGRKYDALLIGDYAISCLAILAKLATFGRIRTVVSLHGNDLYFMRKKSFPSLVYQLLSWLVTRSRMLDAAVANSQAIRREAELHGISSISVIPLATTAPPNLANNERVRRPQIIFAGRLIRYKGLSWFVREVWPNVHQSCELLVAGPVWDSYELASLEGQPRIRYLGVLEPNELRNLQGTVCATVMPNLPPDVTGQDEGFGLVALESASVGTPVLASACGGIPEAVSEGITGFLIQPLDHAAWARKLNEILDWPECTRLIFAAIAKNHVEKNHTWQLVADRTLAVLKHSPDRS